MINLIFGFVFVIGVMIFSIYGADKQTYLQWHSMILVFGGSAAILVFSTSTNVLKSILKSMQYLTQEDESFYLYKSDLAKLTKSRTKATESKNELIQYSSDLWAQGIEPELFIVLISQKRKEIESKTMDAVQALKNLAKYPPALGMTGTVVGMIALFSNLDSNKSNIGTSLSLAMTATFYGLVLTNGVISPLADRLHVKQMNQLRIYDAIYEILLLINRGEPASLIAEELDERAS